MILYYGLVLVAVLLTSINQVLLKIGSHQKNNLGHLLSPYLNIYTLIAYTLFFIVTVVSVVALQKVPLKLFYAIASLNFIVVALLSWSILKEEVNRKMVLGLFIIAIGVIVFNL